MKNYCFLFALLFLFSCSDQIAPDSNQSTVSSSTELLEYPSGSGYAGDKVNGLLGYGYDATGLCDTISVRSKVFDSIPGTDIFFGYPRSVFSTSVSGGNFDELTEKINNKNIISESGTALESHIRSLMKLAFKTDSISVNDAFSYYATTYLASHRKYYYGSDIQNYLTAGFKKDITILSAEKLIAKYGTHIITDFYTGVKFEVLYKCKPDVSRSASAAEQGLYKRIKEYAGYVPGIISIDESTKHSQTNEKLIYNTIGSSNKMFGLINATDYNPDSIHLNIKSVFSDTNMKVRFMAIGNDGIIPLYELIKDDAKKKEIKAYIEKYTAK